MTEINVNKEYQRKISIKKRAILKYNEMMRTGAVVSPASPKRES